MQIVSPWQACCDVDDGKKYLECWHIWFVVDVAQVILHHQKYTTDSGLFLCGIVRVYLGMAVAGYFTAQAFDSAGAMKVVVAGLSVAVKVLGC